MFAKEPNHAIHVCRTTFQQKTCHGSNGSPPPDPITTLVHSFSEILSCHLCVQSARRERRRQATSGFSDDANARGPRLAARFQWARATIPPPCSTTPPSSLKA